MIFKPYYYFETGCAACLFGCGGLGKCALVDAHEEDIHAYIAIAFEKRWNPLLAKSREEFVEALAEVTPKPAAMQAILAANQGRAGCSS